MRMQATAVASFGCEATDVNCYCQEPNFGYGIRDCANEACGGDQAQAIISYGRVYCSCKCQQLLSRRLNPTLTRQHSCARWRDRQCRLCLDEAISHRDCRWRGRG